MSAYGIQCYINVVWWFYSELFWRFLKKVIMLMMMQERLRMKRSGLL